jgi:hypothetical protein
MPRKTTLWTHLLLRLLIPLDWRLVHVQDGSLEQQERPYLDVVWSRELEVDVRDGKIGRDGNV